ncbi:MAG TPA: CHRD domain-containing protein [Candidatus Eisenbacteria bacterium]
MRLRDSLLTLLCSVALASTAAAQTTYVGVLTGGSEVPPVVTAATGNATVVLDASQTQLSISVQFQNLTSAYTASHIHGPAPAGTNAGVKWGFVGTTAGWVFGAGNQSGTITNYLVTGVTATDVTNLNAGNFYVNIHSSTFPGGELRAQLGSAPVPALKSTWSRVKSLFR